MQNLVSDGLLLNFCDTIDKLEIRWILCDLCAFDQLWRDILQTMLSCECLDICDKFIVWDVGKRVFDFCRKVVVEVYLSWFTYFGMMCCPWILVDTAFGEYKFKITLLRLTYVSSTM